MTIRDQAIRICAIAASAEIPPTISDRIVLEQELSVDAGCLADEAVCYVMLAHDRVGADDNARAEWAEAEALLRDGWSP